MKIVTSIGTSFLSILLYAVISFILTKLTSLYSASLQNFFVAPLLLSTFYPISFPTLVVALLLGLLIDYKLKWVPWKIILLKSGLYVIFIPIFTTLFWIMLGSPYLD